MVSESDPDPEQIVRDFIAWENGDESKASAVSESLDVYNPGLEGGAVHDREEYDRYLRSVRSGFPDIQFEILDLAVAGELVMAEVGISGTHQGEFKGLPPTDRAVELRAMGKWRIADDQVAEVHIYYDTSELAEQLGLTFPTVVGQLPTLAWRKLRSTI